MIYNVDIAYIANIFPFVKQFQNRAHAASNRQADATLHFAYASYSRNHTNQQEAITKHTNVCSYIYILYYIYMLYICIYNRQKGTNSPIQWPTVTNVCPRTPTHMYINTSDKDPKYSTRVATHISLT